MKKKLFITLILIMIVITLPLATYAQNNVTTETSTNWTIEELIKTAKEKNNEIKVLKMNLEVTVMSEKEIKDLKKLDIDNLLGSQNQNPYRTKSTVELETEMNLSKIVLPLQYQLKLSNIKRQIELKEIEVENNVQVKLYDYLKLLDELEKIKLAIKRSELNLKTMQLQYQNGLTTKLDVNKIELNLEQLTLQKNFIEKNIKISKMNINKLIGEDLRKNFQLDQSVYDNIKLDSFNKIDFTNSEEYINIALNHRPDYLTLKENRDINKKINDIYIQNYTYITDDAKRIKKEKEIEYIISELELNSLEQDITIQVTHQLTYLENLVQQLDLQKKFINNMLKTFERTELLFKNGMATFDQVLETEIQLLDAEKKEIEISYNIKTALAQFELILGTKLDIVED